MPFSPYASPPGFTLVGPARSSPIASTSRKASRHPPVFFAPGLKYSVFALFLLRSPHGVRVSSLATCCRLPCAPPRCIPPPLWATIHPSCLFASFRFLSFPAVFWFLLFFGESFTYCFQPFTRLPLSESSRLTSPLFCFPLAGIPFCPVTRYMRLCLTSFSLSHFPHTFVCNAAPFSRVRPPFPYRPFGPHLLFGAASVICRFLY